jgi:hypothetical protein
MNHVNSYELLKQEGNFKGTIFELEHNKFSKIKSTICISFVSFQIWRYKKSKHIFFFLIGELNGRSQNECDLHVHSFERLNTVNEQISVDLIQHDNMKLYAISPQSPTFMA